MIPLDLCTPPIPVTRKLFVRTLDVERKETKQNFRKLFSFASATTEQHNVQLTSGALRAVYNANPDTGICEYERFLWYGRSVPTLTILLDVSI